MKPVEQRELHAPGQVGDCWKCCFASILELDYDDVPHFFQMEEDGDVTSGWNTTIAFLRERGFALASFGLHGDEQPLLMFGNEKPAYHFSAPGHWIAGVISARRHAVTGEEISHSVVMSGSSIAWDPHPLREEGHRGFEQAYLLVAA